MLTNFYRIVFTNYKWYNSSTIGRMPTSGKDLIKERVSRGWTIKSQKIKAMRYHFKIRKEKNGFSAVCVELPGCVTQGATPEELRAHMEEALNLYLDEPADSKAIFPLPKKRLNGRAVVQVEVLPRVAFAFALRMTRLRSRLTQREAAEKVGIVGALNNYQRLEDSKTANPVLETLVKIKRAFPDFPLEQVAS